MAFLVKLFRKAKPKPASRRQPFTAGQPRFERKARACIKRAAFLTNCLEKLAGDRL
jgi:hypothetical protein